MEKHCLYRHPTLTKALFTMAEQSITPIFARQHVEPMTRFMNSASCYFDDHCMISCLSRLHNVLLQNNMIFDVCPSRKNASGHLPPPLLRHFPGTCGPTIKSYILRLSYLLFTVCSIHSIFIFTLI